MLAHDELLDLAGDGHSEAIDELDVTRNFVVRDLVPAKLAELLGCRGRASLELYPGAQFFAVFWIRHAHDLHRARPAVDVSAPVACRQSARAAGAHRGWLG